MLLTRYGHQRKLNSPTVRRRQFLPMGSFSQGPSRLLAVPTIDAHPGPKYMREMMCSLPPTAIQSLV
jgi:hypothetical protein